MLLTNTIKFLAGLAATLFKKPPNKGIKMETTITLDVKQFTNALKYVVKFAKNSGNYAPLLGFVHLTNKYLEYCGYENYLKIPLQSISSTGDFSAVLKISQLSDNTKNAKGIKDFTITVASDEATLTVGGGNYKVTLGDLSDWKHRALDGFSPNTTGSKTSFCCDFGLIEKCIPFAACDNNRPALYGVFVDKVNLALFASDSNRLISVKLWADSLESYTSNETLLIPLDLLKAVKGIKGVVNVIKTPSYRDGCWVTILSEGSIFAWHGLSEANFPDYASLLTKAYKYGFKFEADITPMLKSATPASILSFTGSTMLVETYDSYLNVNSKKLVGSRTVKVDVLKCIDQYMTTPSPLQVGLNPKYLLDALAICQKGDYNISLNAPPSGVVDSAILVKNTSAHNEVLVLVMPMGLK